MDILRMLEQLHENVILRPRHFGPLTWGLDVEDTAMQISKIRASLPQEVKQAANLTRESERIVEAAREDAESQLLAAKREAEKIVQDAHAEAKRIIDQAQIEREKMVSENEILKLAKAQSEEMRVAADRDAVAVRRGADMYALDVLNKLETVAGKVMTAIDAGKAEIAKPESPSERAPVPIRERVRVQ